MGNYTFIIDKFEQIQREIGLTNFTGFFEMAVNGLPGIIEQKKLSIDVYHATAALPLIRKTAKQLNDNGQYVFRIATKATQISSGAFPNIQASVALLLIDEDFMEEAFLQQIIKQKSEDYSVILVRNYTGNTEIEDELRQRLPSSVEVVNLPLSNDENDDILVQLDACLNTKSYNHAKLTDIAIARSVVPLVNTLKEIIATEARISTTQKQLTSQDNNILRKEESGSLSSEITTATRQIIQKNILDTEKGFKAKYDEKNKPNIGDFSIQSDIFASMLSFDDLEKKEVAEKSEKIETQIEGRKIETYKESIASNLKEEMQKDLSFLDISAIETVNKINRILRDKGLKTIDTANFINPVIETDKIINANNYFQRPYIGEVTKKGVMEYFVALRDYTGIIMVVVGLFGPLTMLSSAPTDEKEGWLAFLSTVSLYLKQVKTFIQVFTIVTILFMIIYGIFDLRKRIPRKRQEEQDREVKKARENLMQEGKRIYTDSSRDWVAMLSNYIREFAQNISNEVELILRNSVANKQELLLNKRNEFQINQQSVDLKIRSIQMAEKEYDMLQRRLMEINDKLTG